MKIPYLSFEYQHGIMLEEFKSAFDQVLDSAWFIMGNNLKEFEEAYAKLSNTNYSVGVANIKNFMTQLKSPPQFVTNSEGGSGFVELATHLLQLKK